MWNKIFLSNERFQFKVYPLYPYYIKCGILYMYYCHTGGRLLYNTYQSFYTLYIPVCYEQSIWYIDYMVQHLT